MYSLGELLKDVACSEYDKSIYVSGVSEDSRSVERDGMFVCLCGTKCDGCSFITDAVNNGAKVIICEKRYKKRLKDAQIITVDDARSAYAHICARMHGYKNGDMTMMAVTGTNGKSSVCEMLAHCLTLHGKRVGLIGTLGAFFEGERLLDTGMTTPDPPLLFKLIADMRARGADCIVMEASSHALALSKLAPIRFELAAVTNISIDHMDFHGNTESYAGAKMRLFDNCEKGVFLTDCIHTVQMYRNAKCKKVSVCTVGGLENADYRAENIRVGLELGAAFTALHVGGERSIVCPVPAVFTVPNALICYAVLTEAGLDCEVTASALASFSGVKGRMERLTHGGDIDIFIDFAHTPDALAKALESLRLTCKGRRLTCLFGCGGERDVTKRPLMGRVASALADRVIVTSDNCRGEDADSIISAVMRGVDKGKAHARIDDRRAAIEYAVLSASPDEVIVLCGKGHEEYEIGKNGKIPFSEREITLAALEKRKGNGGKA